MGALSDTANVTAAGSYGSNGETAFVFAFRRERLRQELNAGDQHASPM